jgi:threonine synthase
MPAGCPSCSEEARPSNTMPVYKRLTPLRPGRLSGRSIARYATQLPTSREGIVSLGEGLTPLLSVHGLGDEIGLPRLLVKDERRNPTGGWRDRFAAIALTHVSEGGTVGCTGSAPLCAAVAAYAARAGLRSVSLIEASDEGVAQRARDAIEGVGGRALGVVGNQHRWTLLAEAERSLSWRAVSNRTSPPIGGDPIATEGYKTIAYEIAEDLAFAAPEYVMVMAMLGDGVQGIWRGFRELAEWGLIERPPRMVAVEVAGAVASALSAGRDWVAPSGESRAPASELAGVSGTVQTLRAVLDSEGFVVRVSESELEAARIALGELEGVWADLGGAASVAAATKLASRDSIPAESRCVCVVTGHGAFDETAHATGRLEHVEPRVDELLRVLAVRSS